MQNSRAEALADLCVEAGCALGASFANEPEEDQIEFLVDNGWSIEKLEEALKDD